MSTQNPDINSQIDRILTSNIRDQLLSHIPFQFLQSPCIQKSSKKSQHMSSSRRSFSRQQLQEDLYQKAEQILKLKETLQSELVSINQIVQDNQKLTEANLFLKSQLNKIKNQWKSFKLDVIKQMSALKQEIRLCQTQNIKKIKLFSENIESKKQSFKISSYFSIKNSLHSLEEAKRPNLSSPSITNKVIEHSVLSEKLKKVNSQCQTIMRNQQIQALQQQINQINAVVSALKLENDTLKKQLDSRRFVSPESQNQRALQQKATNKQNIECYSSVFLKSVFSESQDPAQVIRTVLFKSQKSIFNQLQVSKYFGKIVLGKKNGSALEEYKNGFHYQGTFSRNYRSGLGKLFYKGNLIYAGEWSQGKFSGKGVLYYDLNLNVQKIQGNFRKGKLEGCASVSLKSGEKIRAMFKNNLILSQGMIVMSDGNLLELHKGALIHNMDGQRVRKMMLN